MNARIILLVVGLLIGGMAGWLTRPEAAQINVGPVQIEVQGSGTAQGSGPLTSGQTQHVALFAVIGALVGFAVGYVVDRRGKA
jgi:uncharacterized membrane-anchored protein YhcB (DUF1043 family)